VYTKRKDELDKTRVKQQRGLGLEILIIFLFHKCHFFSRFWYKVLHYHNTK